MHTRIPPTSDTCRRGHPRTPATTIWRDHPNGRAYAECRLCRRFNARRNPTPEQLATRELEKAQHRQQLRDTRRANLLANHDPDPNGCWLWRGSPDSWGYGRCQVDGKWIGAHRYVYEQLVGPIPAGKELDHLCRRPLCVNPQHLEPVTTIQNQQRANPTALTEDLVRKIRSEYQPGVVGYKTLARKYGVSPKTICRVILRLSWRDVGP